MAAVALALAGAAFQPVTASAASTWLWVRLDSNCVGGKARADVAVRLTLRSAADEFRARLTTRSDHAGEWHDCFDEEYAVRAGDRLVTLVAGKYRRVRVPNLSVRADRVRDVISGRAPKGALVRIEVCQLDGLNWGACEIVIRKERADEQGRYSGSLEIRGGDTVDVDVRNASGDRFRAYARVPLMIVRVQSDVVGGHARPGSDVAIEVRRGGEVVGRGHAVASRSDGAFTVVLARTGDLSAHPRPGDRVTASFASDASLVVPRMWVKGDVSDDRVTGRCSPDAVDLEVVVQRRSGSRDDTDYTIDDESVDSTGHFDFIAWSGIRKLDRIYLGCQAVTGDQVLRIGQVGP